MVANLGRSSCCDNIVKLSDLINKPIEFRRYQNYAPHIGTKWTCPTCLKNYFVIWMRYDKFEHDIGNINGEDIGSFALVLVYYDLTLSYGWEACSSADDVQWIWNFYN